MGDEIQDVGLHPGEEFPLQANFEDVLAEGEALVSATAAAFDSDGVSAAGILSGSPVVVTPRAQQRITMGAGILLGEDYLVVLTGTTALGLDYVQRFRVRTEPIVELAPEVIAEGGPDDNSYVTLDDAEAYFDTRLLSAAWEAATVRDRARALIAAARDIDALRLKGTKADVAFDIATPARYAQVMAFPRAYTIDGAGEWSVPREVLDAQLEQALFLLAGGSGSDRRRRLQAQGVQSFSVEGMSETYRVGAGSGGLRIWDRLCPDAQRLLGRHVDWSIGVARS
jgi:hypothetical protein